MKSLGRAVIYASLAHLTVFTVISSYGPVVRRQSFGEFLMLLAALGLAVFGVYGLCEARWRRI